MKVLVTSFLALGVLAASAPQAQAAACAAGVYRAGCVGPNGAAVAHRPVAPPPHATCAAGVHRAGCVGPNGAVVTTRPASPHCYYRNGVRVCG